MNYRWNVCYKLTLLPLCVCGEGKVPGKTKPAFLKQTRTVEQPLMMHGVNRETTSNQLQPGRGADPGVVLVEFLFAFLNVLLILLPTLSLSFCLSVCLSPSLSLPTLRSRLLGFLAEHRDQRKKKKKKPEGRIYEGHPC